MEKKTDLRVVRTRKALRDAFNELMDETAVAGITVKTLAERAGINRKTFYLHYEAIEAFYDDIMYEVMDDFFSSRETVTEAEHDIAEDVRCFFLYMAGQDPAIERLACSPDTYDFGERVFLPRIIQHINRYDPLGWQSPEKAILVRTFVCNSALSFYRQWVGCGKAVPEDEAAQLLSDMTCNGIRYLFR